MFFESYSDKEYQQLTATNAPKKWRELCIL